MKKRSLKQLDDLVEHTIIPALYEDFEGEDEIELLEALVKKLQKRLSC
jgi:hypothetical protein